MAEEKEKGVDTDLEEQILFSLMEGEREGDPGLGGSVSKGREKVNTRQMQETMCKAFGVHGGKLQNIRL